MRGGGERGVERAKAVIKVRYSGIEFFIQLLEVSQKQKETRFADLAPFALPKF